MNGGTIVQCNESDFVVASFCADPAFHHHRDSSLHLEQVNNFDA
jgi:hypothetical protein